MCRIFSLDEGESQALALMENYPEGILLTDDAAARLVAEQMGFRVHGTVGIIVRSIRRGQRQPEEVLNILGEIPSKSTLYIRPSLLEEVKVSIKDQFKL
jgi:predicted nucleic acid-binding protein